MKKFLICAVVLVVAFGAGYAKALSDVGSAIASQHNDAITELLSGHTPSALASALPSAIPSSLPFSLPSGHVATPAKKAPAKSH